MDHVRDVLQYVGHDTRDTTVRELREPTGKELRRLRSRANRQLSPLLHTAPVQVGVDMDVCEK